jgi:predicted MFS family arabinose efflux permease
LFRSAPVVFCESIHNWILPALLIIVGAITNGFFNPANSMAMISMMPAEHRGFASAVNHVTFGLGNVLGVALSSLLMSVAFEQHTGSAGTALTAANPLGFVAALKCHLSCSRRVELGWLGDFSSRQRAKTLGGGGLRCFCRILTGPQARLANRQ